MKKNTSILRLAVAATFFISLCPTYALSADREPSQSQTEISSKGLGQITMRSNQTSQGLQNAQNTSNTLVSVTFILLAVVVIGLIVSPHHHSSPADREMDDMAKQLADPNCKDPDSIEAKLAAKGKPAIRRAINLSHNHDPEIRCRAAAVLGGIKDPDSIKALNSMVKDKDPKVQAAATAALALVNPGNS